MTKKPKEFDRHIKFCAAARYMSASSYLQQEPVNYALPDVRFLFLNEAGY